MIKFLDLQKINLQYQNEIEEALLNTFRSGWYLLGKEVKDFETNLKKYLDSDHVVGVANGLDALRLIFRAYMELGIIEVGDEVIVPANTYIASVLAITDNNLVPVFVEPNLFTYNIDIAKIEEKITNKTKAILVVHLYGRIAFSNDLQALSKRYNLQIVEDNAQSIGAKWNGFSSGNLGNAGAFSFYPGKNLGALGDAGAIATNDSQLALAIRTLANYGSKEKYINVYKGLNSRLDEIHAAVLNVKLKYIDKENKRRREIALRYCSQIKNKKITLPQFPKEAEEHVWHLFVIRTESRDKLQEYLLEHNIQTLIHYPIPPHFQKAYEEYKDLKLPITEKIHNEVLSLPLSPVLTDDEVDTIIFTLNGYD